MGKASIRQIKGDVEGAKGHFAVDDRARFAEWARAVGVQQPGLRDAEVHRVEAGFLHQFAHRRLAPVWLPPGHILQPFENPPGIGFVVEPIQDVLPRLPGAGSGGARIFQDGFQGAGQARRISGFVRQALLAIRENFPWTAGIRIHDGLAEQDAFQQGPPQGFHFRTGDHHVHLPHEGIGIVREIRPDKSIRKRGIRDLPMQRAGIRRVGHQARQHAADVAAFLAELQTGSDEIGLSFFAGNGTENAHRQRRAGRSGFVPAAGRRGRGKRGRNPHVAVHGHGLAVRIPAEQGVFHVFRDAEHRIAAGVEGLHAFPEAERKRQMVVPFAVFAGGQRVGQAERLGAPGAPGRHDGLGKNDVGREFPDLRNEGVPHHFESAGQGRQGRRLLRGVGPPPAAALQRTFRRHVHGAARFDQRLAQRARRREDGRAQDAPRGQSLDQIDQGPFGSGQIDRMGKEQHRQGRGFPDAQHVVIGFPVPRLHHGDVHGLVQRVEPGFPVVDGEQAEVLAVQKGDDLLRARAGDLHHLGIHLQQDGHVAAGVQRPGEPLQHFQFVAVRIGLDEDAPALLRADDVVEARRGDLDAGEGFRAGMGIQAPVVRGFGFAELGAAGLRRHGGRNAGRALRAEAVELQVFLQHPEVVFDRFDRRDPDARVRLGGQQGVVAVVGPHVDEQVFPRHELFDDPGRQHLVAIGVDRHEPRRDVHVEIVAGGPDAGQRIQVIVVFQEFVHGKTASNRCPPFMESAKSWFATLRPNRDPCRKSLSGRISPNGPWRADTAPVRNCPAAGIRLF